MTTISGAVCLNRISIFWTMVGLFFSFCAVVLWFTILECLRADRMLEKK